MKDSTDIIVKTIGNFTNNPISRLAENPFKIIEDMLKGD